MTGVFAKKSNKTWEKGVFCDDGTGFEPKPNGFSARELPPVVHPDCLFGKIYGLFTVEIVDMTENSSLILLIGKSGLTRRGLY